MNSMMLKDQNYIAGTYKRFPLEIVSGKGSLVYDADGKEYIDMGSGIAVTSFGIGHRPARHAAAHVESLLHRPLHQAG